MNVKILTLVLMLLLSLLSSGGAGPMASVDQGKGVDVGNLRRLVQQSPARAAQSHRAAGWRRRRPRPRLSHKGPMPF
ncbi:apelin [Brienomyrus brachyistius]|uniref:apelin n=1 Tax=Brienomyrus brachyistius TaxID=42636 RepID=UPI0020B19B89|nr:apelin [Brienomyrus brachyistius]